MSTLAVKLRRVLPAATHETYQVLTVSPWEFDLADFDPNSTALLSTAG
jgi:hypothetical protein